MNESDWCNQERETGGALESGEEEREYERSEKARRIE
jgi:hypothetical protein